MPPKESLYLLAVAITALLRTCLLVLQGEDATQPDQNQESTDNENFTTGVYSLLCDEQFQDESNDTGYDEVDDQDAISSRYETDDDLQKAENERDYEEPYWEPANKEEELMVQLAKLNVQVIAAENIK